jgi:hemin uptake protein HemP
VTDESSEQRVEPRTTLTDAGATPPATRRPIPADEAPPRFDTASLFQGSSEVRLLHRGQEYRLRVTKQGKLILTK